VYEKDSGVWAEARKPARTAVFSLPSRDWDLALRIVSAESNVMGAANSEGKIEAGLA
jgi:hypothetical protein